MQAEAPAPRCRAPIRASRGRASSRPRPAPETAGRSCRLWACSLSPSAACSADTLLSGSDSRAEVTLSAGRSSGTLERADRMSMASCCPISRAVYRRCAADVDVIDVAAGTRAEDGDELVAELPAQFGGEVPGIVGRVLGTADGIEMHREHAQRADRLLIPREQQKRHIRIDGARRLHDVRIQHPGVEPNGAVLQMKTAVEREHGLPGRARIP